jgi:hypothetical protein
MAQNENIEVVSQTLVEPLVHEETQMPSYFEDILDKGTESHITWLLIASLMRHIIKCGAIIFGGAVRDSILHGFASREFYKLSTLDKYDDPTIHPELSDRFLLPTDIDLFITEKDHYNLKLHLYKRGYYYKEIKHIDLSYINPKLRHRDYELIKAEIIYFDKKNKKSYLILLDMIICHGGKIVIPPMDSDFSVNKLMISRKGIVTMSCDWNYEQIEKHIHNKEAFCNSTISERRYEKLNRKGWKITMNYSIFVFKLRINEEEETCVICLDPLKVGELEVTPRDCKCKYSYCKDCIKYSLKSSQCLMCKKDMCLVKKTFDIIRYEKHKVLDN